MVHGQPHRIVPDGCIDILVSMGEASAHVVGTMTRPLLSGGRAVATAAVRFRPGGAAPFLGVAAHELTDRRIPFEDLGTLELPPEIWDARNLTEAVGQLERWLLERLGHVAAPSRAVARAVAVSFGASPPSVAELARELDWSRQHLRRKVLDEVGLSPKQLMRIGRLQRAIQMLQANPELSLAQAGASLGYFDQAHMCRDFRRLVGTTPAFARTSAGSIFPIPSLLSHA